MIKKLIRYGLLLNVWSILFVLGLLSGIVTETHLAFMMWVDFGWIGGSSIYLFLVK